MNFRDFGLAEPIVRAISKEGYSVATPIQAQAIPVVLSGHDVIGIAQTGTGKTAAFALPIIHQLITSKSGRESGHRPVQILILASTRGRLPQCDPLRFMVALVSNLRFARCGRVSMLSSRHPAV